MSSDEVEGNSTAQSQSITEEPGSEMLKAAESGPASYSVLAFALAVMEYHMWDVEGS